MNDLNERARKSTARKQATNTDFEPISRSWGALRPPTRNGGREAWPTVVLGRLGSISRTAAAAVMMLFLVRCGGPICGAETEEQDGECVPTTSGVTCSAGTTLDSDTQRCVADLDMPCGEGTTHNPDTGECEADLSSCAPGTVAMGAQCVPDGSVICTGSTTFDADTGRCMLTAEACREGSVLLDGECVSADAALTPDTLAAEEPDDPGFDGAPASFLVPDEGEKRTLGGCITPADFNDDEVIDADIDRFAFSVAKPGLYRVHADGLGGASAAFAVLAESGQLANQDWMRVGIDLTNDGSERQIYIPTAGNYTLLIFDSRSVDLDEIARGELAFAHVAGGEDTCYFVTVESMPVPTPTPLTGGKTTGTVGSAPELYEIAATDRTIYRSTLTDDDAVTLMGQTVTVDPTVTAGQGVLVSPAVDADDTALFVVDHVASLSLDTVTWNLKMDQVPEIPVDGEVTITHDPGEASGVYYAFEAQAGDVVRASFSSTESVEARVWGPSLTHEQPVCVSSRGALMAGTDCELYYVAQQSGSQLVQVFAPLATAGSMYTVNFDIDVQTPPTLDLGTPNAVKFDDERTFVRADLSSTLWGRFAVSGFTGSGFGEVDVRYFDEETAFALSIAVGGTTRFNATPIDSQGGVFDSFDRIYGPELGPVALIELADPIGYDGDEEVTIEISEEPYIDVTVDPSTPVVRSGDAVPSGEPALYLVRGVPGGNVTFEVAGTGGADPRVEVLDERAQATTTVDATGPGGTETTTQLMPFSGWLAFAVDVPGGGLVDVGVTQEQPPYSASSGSTPYFSICPSAGGPGTVLTTTNPDSDPTAPGDDEGLTAFHAFSTFSGGMFFESPVAGAIISTNGWMTFDASYAGGALSAHAELANPDPPGDLVAPLWIDLEDVEVCVQDEASRFIVEWNGHESGGHRTVQMQVVMLGDGSFEFVFGPAHRLLDEFATVGLENGDGSIGIDPRIGVRRSSSILFTPR